MLTLPHMSFEPLTPTAFLRRSASVFADRVAVIDGDFSYTYAEGKVKEILNRALVLTK